MRSSKAIRFYQELLRFYPAEFREEYGRELCLVLRDRCREEQSLLGFIRVWLHAALGVLAGAPQEHFHMIANDLKYALRILRKDAAVSAFAIAILALGIGSTTLVFSVANTLLLRPLPYGDPDRLVAVLEHDPKIDRLAGDLAFPNYYDLRARARLLEDLAVYSEQSGTLRGDGAAEQIAVARVSDGLFRVLKVQPLMGRTFNRADDVPNSPGVTILSHSLWQRRYGADRNILGRTLQLGDSLVTVVGVMPAGFRFAQVADAWTPLQMDPATAPRTDMFLSGIARLKPGVTAAQATAELHSLMAQINRENPITDRGNTARAVPIRQSLAGSYRDAVVSLLVAVAFLLIIACANVSNLLLVKASARKREIAVRTALGATRRRLIRQLFSESVVLGAAGGIGGLLLVYAGLPALLSLVPVDLPGWMNFSVDYRVLVFAAGASIMTSVIFGVVPAFTISSDVTDALKEAGRTGMTSFRQRFARNALVIAEVALSVTLLIGAGLMIRSFLALRHQNLGYRTENVLTLRVTPPGTEYPNGPKARELLRRLDAEVASLPGVVSSVFASGVPMGNRWGRSITVEGQPVVALRDALSIFNVVTTPGYFRTLQIPVREGRDFTPADFDNPEVTIMAESLARKFWPNDSAIGKRVRYGSLEKINPWHTVVGVVADARNEAIKGQGRKNIYIPWHKGYTPSYLMVRTVSDPQQIAHAVAARITGVDRNIVVSRILTLDQIVGRAAWQDRFFTALFAIFAVIATVLGAAGLYAVLAYTVALRTNEIGIRMALGARASQVRAMVMRQGLSLAGAGVLLGAVAAAALTRLLESQLYQTSPLDPRVYAAVVLLMLGVSVVAVTVPARRATRLDPTIALRHE